MLKIWDDYAGAIDKLENDTGTVKYTRTGATEFLEMPNSAFSREVLNNSMFLAKNNPEITSTATYYDRLALLEHFKRLRDEVEPAQLIIDKHTLSESEFNEKYVNPRDVVFAKGTYLLIGGQV